MPRPFRFSVVAVFVALVACGGERGDRSGPTGALDPAGKWTCSGVVADIVTEIFPPRGLRNSALARCANIQRQYARGKVLDATGMVHELIDDAVAHAANGKLLVPQNGTLEEALAALVTALLGEVGLQPGAGEVVVAPVDETGGDVETPSQHAALSFEPNDVSGETWVTIVHIPDPFQAGACPFGFPVPYDCYPLFFDFSIQPVSNLQSPVTAGLCVVDSGPLAPPNPVVAGRLQLASPDPNAPGQIVFWPVVPAPGGVDCSDLAFAPTGWQLDMVGLLGPFARLFEVTPAWASPGKLGASISSFSPVAATDPVVGGSTTLVDCPVGTPGDLLFRGFYSLSWPGSTLDTVEMWFANDSGGTHSIELSARLDGFAGPLVGADTVGVTLAGGMSESAATFTFPSPTIVAGDTVAFALSQISGPAGPGFEVFYSVPATGDANCPIVQTNGTTPPLDTFRRQGVKVRIFGAP